MDRKINFPWDIFYLSPLHREEEACYNVIVKWNKAVATVTALGN